MAGVITCPGCGEEIQEENFGEDEEVVCPQCGYVLDESDLEKDDIDDLIELDLASDGELDGDLFDF